MAIQAKKSAILLVEDEPILSELLVRRFEKEGYAVRIAHDGAEAMQIMKAERFDLILLDLCLPRQSGFETMQQLAQEKNIHRAPIIVISNLSSPEDIARAENLGAAAYWVKTKISHDEIIHRINELLETKEPE